MAVYDVMGTLRSTLLHDGSVVDPRGELIAYIEADGTVGDVNLAYVGEVTAPNGNSLGFVTDANDDMIAQVSMTALGTRTTAAPADGRLPHTCCAIRAAPSLRRSTTA